jgi:[citrate (pro-3S)-lyase] ligase
MEDIILDLRSISLKNKKEIQKLKNFLIERDLNLDDDLEYAVVIEENDQIIATGSMSGLVLKCIAVSKDHEGEGLIGKIVTYLLLKAHHEGVDHLFLFTKPDNKKIFSELGFNEISRVENSAILMENNKHGLSGYLANLSASKVAGKNIASIVMNCNPFTNGHLFLIEKAASENDHVHIFIVDENRSLFPTDVRLKLVKEGTRHLKNVSVHHSGPYIISSATFPSYFLKDSKKIIDTHGRMDLDLFTRSICPALSINRRYAGEEPLCPVTNHYNELMEELLPAAGIELIIVKRKENKEQVISASFVRNLLRNDDFKNIEKIVPPTTLKFLRSIEAEPIINKIKGKVNENS